MIRFKCAMCGRVMRVRDKYAGKTGKCPRCRELLRVPGFRPEAQSKAPLPATDSASAAPPGFVAASQTSDSAEINQSAESLRDARNRAVRTMTFRGRIINFFEPSYDEVSVFAISLTVLLLYSASATFRHQVSKFFFSERNDGLIVLFVVTICGLLLPFYHVFSTKPKSFVAKMAMLGVAVFVSAVAGICAGFHVIKHAVGMFAVFPLWNIVNGVVLLYMLRYGYIDESCFDDHDASFGEALLALVCIMIVFSICHFALRLHWAVKFSICVVYATSVNKAVRKVFCPDVKTD